MIVKEVPLKKVRTKENYRTTLGDLGSLMQSMKQKGLINPITVFKNGSGFIAIAGHRRLAAAQRLGWTKVPVAIRQDIGADSILVNIDENLNREGVSMYETGRAIFQLRDKFKMTDSEIGARLGLSATKVKSIVDIYLKVPKSVQKKIIGATKPGGAVRRGYITSTAAEQVMSAYKHQKISYPQAKNILESVVKEQITNRDVREVVRKVEAGKTIAQAKKSERMTHLMELRFYLNKKSYKQLCKQFKTHTGLVQHMKSILKKDRDIGRAML